MKDIFDDQLQAYLKLADKADKRLRGLEKAAKREHNDKYLKYAYSVAMRDIKANFGGGNTFQRRIKWNEQDPDKSFKALREAEADVNKFLDFDTSHYEGFREVEEKRYQTLSKYKAFEGVSQEEWLKLTQVGIFDLLDKDFGFGYKTAMRIAKQLLKNKKNVMSRKQKTTFETLKNVLDKYKFKNDPGLFEIVQGRLEDIKK